MLILARCVNDKTYLYQDGQLLGTVIVSSITPDGIVRLGFKFPRTVEICRDNAVDKEGAKRKDRSMVPQQRSAARSPWLSGCDLPYAEEIVETLDLLGSNDIRLAAVQLKMALTAAVYGQMTPREVEEILDAFDAAMSRNVV